MKKGLYFCINENIMVCLGSDVEYDEYGIYSVIDRYVINYIYFRCIVDLIFIIM